jgi:integrase
MARKVKPDIGEGSFVYRSGAWVFKFYQEGKQRDFTVARGERSDLGVMRAAEKAARQRLEELKTTGLIAPKNLTLSDVWERFIAEGGKRGKPYKPKTKQDYENIWARLIEPELGAVRVSKITIDTLNRFRTDLAGKSAGERRKDQALLLLKSIISFAYYRHFIDYNPGKFIQVDPTARRPREMKARKKTEALIAATRKDYRPLVLALLYLGLRINEACVLQWRDLELREDSANPEAFAVCSVNRGLSAGEVVPIPKTTAAFRDIPIPERLRAVLLELQQQQKEEGLYAEDGWVFQTRGRGILKKTGKLDPRAGKRIDPDNFRQNVFNPAKVSAGLDNINIHDIRGIYLTWLSENSTPPHVIMRVGGHESFSTTLRYLSPRDKQLQAIVDIFKDAPAKGRAGKQGRKQGKGRTAEKNSEPL